MSKNNNKHGHGSGNNNNETLICGICGESACHIISRGETIKMTDTEGNIESESTVYITREYKCCNCLNVEDDNSDMSNNSDVPLS